MPREERNARVLGKKWQQKYEEKKPLLLDEDVALNEVAADDEDVACCCWCWTRFDVDADVDVIVDPITTDDVVPGENGPATPTPPLRWRGVRLHSVWLQLQWQVIWWRECWGQMTSFFTTNSLNRYPFQNQTPTGQDGIYKIYTK